MSIRSMEDLMRAAKKLGVEETRRESEDYLELVISREKQDELEEALQHYFGTPFKPAGIRPCETCDRVSSSYGGITTDQTLYFTNREELPNAALLWPWMDGKRVTVKIVQDCL